MRCIVCKEVIGKHDDRRDRYVNAMGLVKNGDHHVCCVGQLEIEQRKIMTSCGIPILDREGRKRARAIVEASGQWATKDEYIARYKAAAEQLAAGQPGIEETADAVSRS